MTLSHRRVEKDRLKAERPRRVYFTGYDRIFIFIGSKLIGFGRWIGRRGMENKSKKDRAMLWIAGKVAPAGLAVSCWRYPPLEDRSKKFPGPSNDKKFVLSQLLR
jgi:hypothetical protein